VNAADKSLAEAVLRRLCVGARVDGIRFGVIPQLLITDPGSGKPPIQGQVYLNLGSNWQVFPERPLSFPVGEGAVPELEEAEELRQLCELREAEIVAAELAVDAPDLILTFADGRVFFLSGRHDDYEMWELGVAFAPGPRFLVVACPGSDVAVWSPPGFDPTAPAA
jgi:hypothetical protein